jgi:integrase
MTFFDPDALANLLKNADQYKKFDVELPNGIAIRNINTPEDLAGAEKILKQLNATIPQNPVVSTPTPPAIQGGITLEEMTEKYATRKDGKNSDKTNYEYRNYHKHFSKWLAIRKDNKAFPLRLITESDISDYIDDLKANGKSDRTIQDKYLAALSSLFVLAQASGAYPKGDSNPARGHKVFSKNDLKKVGNKTEYKPFTNDELQKIFSPKSLLAMPRPADFWLPILALHTGGRIEELCQLAITDILKVDDIWAISINDDDYKSVKSDAARREVPIHPQLIQLGFLDYVEDAKKYGTMLFPYLVPDQFGKFSPTPSERFGKYLDTLEIIDKHKVFHSFRKTANNHLKQKGVPEEMRCQYVGHERESLNSNTYAEKFSVSFLAENVSKHLIFDAVDFSQLTYQKGRFSEELARLSKTKRHREIIQERKAAVKKAQEKTSVASSPTTKSKAT